MDKLESFKVKSFIDCHWLCLQTTKELVLIKAGNLWSELSSIGNRAEILKCLSGLHWFYFKYHRLQVEWEIFVQGEQRFLCKLADNFQNTAVISVII